MLVALRALEIVVLLAVLGLPINLVLLTRAELGFRAKDVSVPVLLAPAMGLAALATYVSMFFATNQPVNNAAGPFWLLLAGVWLALWFSRQQRRAKSLLRKNPTTSFRTLGC